MFLPDLADEFWLDLALAAVSVTHRKHNLFIFYIILPQRAMSDLVLFRSANHWLSDERLSDERKGKFKK
jgi:hypothetical protein